jgi:hypothetical protein
MPEPIHVTTGFNWTAGGAWTAVALIVVALARQINPWRKASIDAGERLRDDLLRRVEKLERELDRKEVRHQAERSLDRHKLNNVSQCFDAMIIMLEAAPEKVAEIVVRIKEMRKRQLEAEAIEKATIHAAEIADIEERDAYRERDAARAAL